MRLSDLEEVLKRKRLDAEARGGGGGAGGGAGAGGGGAGAGASWWCIRRRQWSASTGSGGDSGSADSGDTGSAILIRYPTQSDRGKASSGLGYFPTGLCIRQKEEEEKEEKERRSSLVKAFTSPNYFFHPKIKLNTLT